MILVGVRKVLLLVLTVREPAENSLIGVQPRQGLYTHLLTLLHSQVSTSLLTLLHIFETPDKTEHVHW